MHYRKLGRTELEISEIGMGAWAIGGGWGATDDEESIATIHAAIDQGVNFIDTAEGYGDGHSEAVIAKALKQLKSSETRDKIVVATKIPPAPGPWPPSPYCNHKERYSREYLRENIEARLSALQVETIDLLQLHTWTAAWNDDPEPLLVLQKLREEGKLRYIGISTPEQDQDCVIDLMRGGLIDSVQVIFNLFHQEPAASILPVAAQTKTGVIVRCALDEGILAGKYTAEHKFPDDDFRQKYFAGDRLQRSVDRVEEIRQDLDDSKLSTTYSMADLAIRFALDAAGVSCVLTGMRNIEQATSNAQVGSLSPLPEALHKKLQRHNWLRGVWYGGK